MDKPKKKKITEIDWEKHIRECPKDFMLDDHGDVVIGSRDKKPHFPEEDEE